MWLAQTGAQLDGNNRVVLHLVIFSCPFLLRVKHHHVQLVHHRHLSTLCRQWSASQTLQTSLVKRFDLLQRHHWIGWLRVYNARRYARACLRLLLPHQFWQKWHSYWSELNHFEGTRRTIAFCYVSDILNICWTMMGFSCLTFIICLIILIKHLWQSTLYKVL